VKEVKLTFVAGFCWPHVLKSGCRCLSHGQQ